MGGGGADAGQAANREDDGPGLFGSLYDGLAGVWGDAAPGQLAGGGVAGPILDHNEPVIESGQVEGAWLDRFANGAKDAVLRQYPGYGTLWDYDGAVKVKPAGWMVLAGLAMGAYLMFSGGNGRRRRR